jgi:HSP20 family protein
VDRLFADLFPGGRHGASNEARAPVDVYLTDGPPPSLTVELDIAGVDPARVDVALVEDVLVVRGERRRAGGGRRAYQHAEIAWGPFERRLRLGVPVDATAARAAYENGILRIRLPLAPAPPAQRVDITVRGGS